MRSLGIAAIDRVSRNLQVPEEVMGGKGAVNQETFEELFVAPSKDIVALDESRQVRSSFISMLSHEFRTPLHAINGFLSIVLSEQVGELNERQREFLGYVHDSAEHLIMLVQDIILLSKADLQQLELHCTDVTLSDVVAQVLRDVGPTASKAGVTLQSQLPQRLPHVWCEAAALQQALINLMYNALKFTPSGGSITIHARRAGDMAEISVKDTGSGVPLEDQPSLQGFGQVYQPEDALLVKYGGFGMGLSVARVIVEQHGGRIWLQSEPGHGSTISFTIPLLQPQQSGHASKDIAQ
jgi:two-component system phosphate regulon sensor histidine kinase PhoR